MIAAFTTSIFLGRTIGASGLGTINLSNQIILVLLVLTMFGMQHVLVKNIAIGHGKGNKSLIKNTIKTAFRFNGSMALLVTVLGMVLAYYFTDNVFSNPSLKTPLLIFLLVLVPQTLTRVYAAAANGMGKVWQSNILEQVLSSLLVLFALFFSYLAKIRITVIYVAILYVSARVLVFAIAFFYWKTIFKYPFKGKVNLKPMLDMALPLLLVSSTSVLAANTDTIMLGIYRTTDEVGLYSVASRIALLTSFMLMVSNTAISPKLAHMYSERNLSGMQKMVRQTTLGVILVASFFLFLFLILGRNILSLWGEEFIGSYIPLIVLCVGQFFNVSTGCSGMLLIMCGHEKLHRNISLLSVTMNIVLNILLIQKHGIVGAAVATSSTVIIENFLKVMYAKKKVGILPTPF